MSCDRTTEKEVRKLRYKERLSRPAACENCPEWSIKACLDCEHIRQRFEIDEQEWELEKHTRSQLRKLLGVDREDQYFVLRWKPCDLPPAEDTSILILQCDAEFGHYCIPGYYCGGAFCYCEGDAFMNEIDADSIIGWDYYPYEECTNTLLENLLYDHLKSFAEDVREGKAQWPNAPGIEKQPEI